MKTRAAGTSPFAPTTPTLWRAASWALWLVPVVLACGSGCAPTAAVGLPAERHPFGANDCVVYVTGIGGEGRDADRLAAGLRAAGFEGDFRIHDWTGTDPPLVALWNAGRQRAESRRLAREIADLRRQPPGRRIAVVAHSGGAGVAVWALEALPGDERVDALVLIAPALSPQYDLTPALRRVQGRATVFTSRGDGLVLGLGTILFGTIGGSHEGAAALSGFRPPPDAERGSYRKLVHEPYRSSWLAYGNDGGHYGSLSTSFVAHVLAPLLHAPAGGVELVARVGVRLEAHRRHATSGRRQSADQSMDPVPVGCHRSRYAETCAGDGRRPRIGLRVRRPVAPHLGHPRTDGVFHARPGAFAGWYVWAGLKHLCSDFSFDPGPSGLYFPRLLRFGVVGCEQIISGASRISCVRRIRARHLKVVSLQGAPSTRHAGLGAGWCGAEPEHQRVARWTSASARLENPHDSRAPR
ncbi:MAG: hypothetical protein AVDCRST_MAG64-3574, partial [uncultured Phycisphaerae bacterium]